MLEINDLTVRYGAITALEGVSLQVPIGKTAAILGANGAGKSSLLRAISGIAPVLAGRIVFDGKNLAGLSATERSRLGIAQAMEGRRLFRQLSVAENLNLAWHFGRRALPFRKAVEQVYVRFPILGERQRLASGLLSGGQQQMLILSCATIRAPRLLLLDEPSLGLAPIIVSQVYDFIREFVRESGVTVVLTEQMASLALKSSDHAIALRRGKVAMRAASSEFISRGVAGGLSSVYL